MGKRESAMNVTPLHEPQDDISKALHNWQLVAEQYGLSKVRYLPPHPLSKPRVVILKKRLAEIGLEGWNEALEHVSVSQFLRGETGREGWKGANIDFFLRQSSLIKILEGDYDDRD